MRYTALRLLLRILVLESGRTTRGLPDGMTGQDEPPALGAAAAPDGRAGGARAQLDGTNSDLTDRCSPRTSLRPPANAHPSSDYDNLYHPRCRGGCRPLLAG